jgi:hypothetical protein
LAKHKVRPLSFLLDDYHCLYPRRTDVETEVGDSRRLNTISKLNEWS